MKITPGDNQLEIAAPAKVNLFLELLGRRADGFHEIETVMSSVSIYDRMRFSIRDEPEIKLGISYATAGSLPNESDEIPADHRNLIWKSIELVREWASAEGKSQQCERGIEVHLQKNIPSAAGLGGASSNAAAAIIAANHLWRLGWPKSQLEKVAAELGSDIGFFLTCGTAVCTGRGEIVQPFTSPCGLPIVVAKPADSLSTAKVFSKVRLEPNELHRTSSNLIQSVQSGRVSKIGSNIFNRLQEFAYSLSSRINDLKTEFNELSCLGHQMSGSGSSYFGVFPNMKAARSAAFRLSTRMPQTRIFYTHTTSAIVH